MKQSSAARPSEFVSVKFTLNGVSTSRVVEARMHAIDFLRTQLGLTGSHVGCEHGACGACTLKIDGSIVRGCLVLAPQLDGSVVTTIEGMSASREIADLQEAFVRHNALQCGYCTSGMLICASELVEKRPTFDRESIREFLSGNYCRCTGYQSIVDAIIDTLERRASES